MTQPDTAVTTEEILNEIVQLTTPVVRLPGDFTANEYIARFRQMNGFAITTGAACPWLDDLVARGILTKHEDVYDVEASRRVTVYRKVGQEKA